MISRRLCKMIYKGRLTSVTDRSRGILLSVLLVLSLGSFLTLPVSCYKYRQSVRGNRSLHTDYAIFTIGDRAPHGKRPSSCGRMGWPDTYSYSPRQIGDSNGSKIHTDSISTPSWTHQSHDDGEICRRAKPAKIDTRRYNR